ncbi:polysaccharide deacetylase family protein [Yinghuangia sp. ASG 101]|uniref:polysaccharide deacetylase family protein n=1 Tax=Yinghuangia sp. ASG 101 TaxID=2896848 RepID=UPI001E41EC26|nr:polysaccharide deacetylase family protein [Yinghuangia sp. ASG 101]UGQ13144.1 polysaccharide deacetylase family protein [Yinghuangia sp. ASG 101]
MNPQRSRRRSTASCLFVSTVATGLAATLAACSGTGAERHGLGGETTIAPPASTAPAATAPSPGDAGSAVAPKPVPGEGDAPLAKPQQIDAAEVAQARQKAAAQWGLAAAPLVAPPPPAVKPRLTDNPPQVMTGSDVPPVVRRVPTDDKVVFLTIDDGAEKDPEFSRMLRELGIPASVFVSDYLVPNYDYFRGLAEQGVAVNNHTINHRDLRKLGSDGLRHEICDQQDNLEQEIGARPRLFRPPYGEYTHETLRVAAECGVEAIPLWNQEVFADHLDYRYADGRFHPGDIILTHFRGPTEWHGSMTDMLRRVVREATAQGFAFARLDDYI